MLEPTRNTLCLALFVKPNAQISDSLLLDVKPFIDSWVICSQGVSEPDRQRISNSLAGIDGEFIESPLRRTVNHYGEVRSVLLKKAQSRADIALMLEANEQLCVLGSLPAIPLDCDAAYIDIVRGRATTRELRIFRREADVTFDYPIGEPVSLANAKTSYLHAVSILGPESHDIWNKDQVANRFLIDAALGRFVASAELSLTLGKIELSHGKIDLALEHLHSVLSMGETDSILWMANYLAGGICAAQSNFVTALKHWQAAFELVPERAEPLMRLAELHFEQEDYQTAALLAEQVSDIEKPLSVDYYEPTVYGVSVDILKARAWHKTARSDDAIAYLNTLLTEQPSEKIEKKIRTTLEEIGRELSERFSSVESSTGYKESSTGEIESSTQESANSHAELGPSSAASPKITIGMATHDDYDGVYFSVMSLVLYHKEHLRNAEILIIDNNPQSKHGEAVRGLAERVPQMRYVAAQEYKGTSIRERVFQEAKGDYVLCMDCHVFLHDGVLARLIEYFDDNPKSKDILHGPIYYDDHDSFSTHMTSGWYGGFYGRWGTNPQGGDMNNSPFEIPMQGLGLFACVKSQWPGFNLKFRGFGGEEGYIHEKFRQRGGKALCLPFLRWTHRFDRPNAPTYTNSWEDRVRNYLVGWDELNLDTAPILEHFSELLGGAGASSMHSRFLLEKQGPFWSYDTIYLYSSTAFDADVLSGIGANRLVKNMSSKAELQDLLRRSVERELPEVLVLIAKTDDKQEFEAALYKSLDGLEQLKQGNSDIKIVESPIFQASLVSKSAFELAADYLEHNDFLSEAV